MLTDSDNSNGAKAFSLYLHIPYCQSKCPYCDFNSHAVASWPEDDYVRALVAEIAVASATLIVASLAAKSRSAVTLTSSSSTAAALMRGTATPRYAFPLASP